MVSSSAGLELLRKPLAEALKRYGEGLEGAAVSDKDGVAALSVAIEGKEARLDPLMRYV